MKKEVLERKLRREVDRCYGNWKYNGQYFTTEISLYLGQGIHIRVQFRSRSGVFEVIPFRIGTLSHNTEIVGQGQEFCGEDCVPHGISWLTEYYLNAVQRFEAQENAIVASQIDYLNEVLKIIA